MSLTKEFSYRYNLYLSHAWNDNNAYKELDSLLGSRDDFDYVWNSLSSHHPINKSKDERKLYEAIKNKMKFCDAVILICGVYSTYSRWVNKELIACKDELNKPLIAVERFEADRSSFIVKQNADIIVEWNAEAIINAVKNYAKMK
ncbi:hypothetical protein SD71_01485 [Cohnella kolymensis]|uniref:Thoeris protein ThsB TIR-like domain-containing protein n=1 Tax=Cohnella kolymensis TaxID=1590652 RepID=A0ABR5A8M4_9BACL|nr:TIR domain-containing protein [Cohnella kolymensis]KIL37374.1 hypothetical protein SD71_01485 [Cohnella kolymensis]